MDFVSLSLSPAEPARAGLPRTKQIRGFRVVLGAVVCCRCFGTAIPPPHLFRRNGGDLNPADSQPWLRAVGPGFFSKSHNELVS